MSPDVYIARPSMDPAAWRRRERLSLRDVAALIGCTRMSVKRYEEGARDPTNSTVVAYKRISKGDVTGEDFDRARRRFLRRAENAKAA